MISFENLDSARQSCLENLAVRSKGLAELYHAAAVFVEQPVFPGRLRLIAHCVREVGNRLPDFAGAPVPSRWDPSRELDGLWHHWQDAGLSLGTDEPDPPEGDDPSAGAAATLSLPVGVYREVQGVLRGHQSRATRRSRFLEMYRAGGVATDSVDSLQPVVREWMAALDWFVAHAHEPHPPVPGPNEQELREQFDRFERLLSGLVQPFYDTASDLDEILAQANT